MRDTLFSDGSGGLALCERGMEPLKIGVGDAQGLLCPCVQTNGGHDSPEIGEHLGVSKDSEGFASGQTAHNYRLL